MILLLPLWPKDKQSFPIAAAVLVAINIFAFLMTNAQQQGVRAAGRNDVKETAQKMAAVLIDPASGVSPEDRVLLEKEFYDSTFPSENARRVIETVRINPSFLPNNLRYEWDLLAPLYDSVKGAAASTADTRTPFQRWGFDPEQDWLPGLFTHAFLHDGWVHLLFNMLFLWMAAAIAEEVLGLHVIWMYLAGGVAAALAQTQIGIPPGQILVGASGAIAALLGFNLVSQPSVRVKLFYFVLLIVIPKYGLFDCPLWFFLPIWLATQVLFSQLAPAGAVMQTAYAAHIGGFLFGCATGLLKRSR